jgi:hypothetical protein
MVSHAPRSMSDKNLFVQTSQRYGRTKTNSSRSHQHGRERCTSGEPQCGQATMRGARETFGRTPASVADFILAFRMPRLSGPGARQIHKRCESLRHLALTMSSPLTGSAAEVWTTAHDGRPDSAPFTFYRTARFSKSNRANTPQHGDMTLFRPMDASKKCLAF